MDPITQGTVGAVAAQSFSTPVKLRAAALLGCCAGLAPDLDVFISSAADPLLFLEYHRQFTHSLVFIPVGAAIVALVFHPLVRRVLRPKESYLACLLGYATHGVLDACTSYGTQLFWPFTDYRVAWNNVSVVDPLFTLPVLALVVAAAVSRRRVLAFVAIGWALAYLLAGVVQTQRAQAAGIALAETRGHEPNRLTVKTGFGNLLVWKIIYEHDGRYYVDAVRVAMRSQVCPGSDIAALALDRDLPWLEAGSQQARDVERFRWFSDDYIAAQPSEPNRVIDVRYSVVPNQIAPLWGIDLDPDAPADRHVGYFADRATGAAQADAYIALLTGAACEALSVR